MKSRMTKCNQQNKDIKNNELLEQNFRKFFSDNEEHSGIAVNLFDIQVKRNLEQGVLFQWCGRWCFDPEKKPFFLQESFSTLMSKKIKYMELEMLQLASKNAGNKAPKVIVMSKSKKASIVVLSFQSSLRLQERLCVKVIGSVHAIWVFDPGRGKALRERGRGRSIPVQSGSFHAMVDLRSVHSAALEKKAGMGIFK